MESEPIANHSKTKAKWIKISAYILAGLILLLTIAYFALNWYVNSHKQQLLSSITEKISGQISGNFEIEDMEPALLHSFPNVSVRLINVSLQDSLYSTYKKNTVTLKSIYIKINLFSLFTAHPQIEKVTLSDGEIYLFKQKNEYSNVYLFQKKEEKKKKKDKGLEFHDFAIENVTFTFDNFLRNKQFKARLDKVDGKVFPHGNIWKIKTSTEAFIYQLGFNLDKGGYLVNSYLKGNLKMELIKDKGILSFPQQKITIDDIPIGLMANFYTKNKPVTFDLALQAPNIDYDKGIHLLTKNISKKLEQINIEKKINANALIKGSFAYPDTPFVDVFFKIKDNIITTSFGAIKKVNFNGSFNNYVDLTKGKNDDNSAVTIPKFTGTWEGIAFNVDSIYLLGLTTPVVDFHLKSQFAIEKLNNIIGRSYNLKKGTALMNIKYHGPVDFKNAIDYSIYGFVKIENTSLTYLPRNLKFKNANATFLFRGADLILDKVNLSSQNSTIEITGIVAKFLNTLTIDPSKAIFDWNIKSKSIDLNEFKSFLQPRGGEKVSIATKNKKVQQLNDNLDDLLAKSTMLLNIDVQKVFYRNFLAKGIKGKMKLSENEMSFKNVKLLHAGGTIIADGSVNQNRKQNPFQLKAIIEKVQVNKLFNAFEDFGQTTIIDSNIKGGFSANIALKGNLGEDVSFVKNSFNGTISFNLKDGELNNFPPLISISKFVFKNRNLDSITFSNLSNELTLKNGKITIPKMDIESSAIRMIVQGIYAFDAGTDLELTIPLRNPEKDKLREKRGLKPKKNKGIILYLRAKDGKDGKVHIGWDPLKTLENDKDDAIFEDDELNNQDTPLVK